MQHFCMCTLQAGTKSARRSAPFSWESCRVRQARQGLPQRLQCPEVSELQSGKDSSAGIALAAHNNMLSDSPMIIDLGRI